MEIKDEIEEAPITTGTGAGHKRGGIPRKRKASGGCWTSLKKKMKNKKEKKKQNTRRENIGCWGFLERKIKEKESECREERGRGTKAGD